jgi:hypothetical protein
MKEYRRAEDLLQPGEKALFVFTAGDNLEINPDGTGHSGYWKITRDPPVDRIVIYLRDPTRPDENELYSGEIAGIDPKRGDGRRLIHLQKMELVGFTRERWRSFASANVNPLRYVTGQ